MNLNIAAKDFPDSLHRTGDIAVQRAADQEPGMTAVLHLEPRPAPHFGQRHQHRRSRTGRSPTGSTTAAGNQWGATRRRLRPAEPSGSAVRTHQHHRRRLNSWYNGLAVQLNKRMAQGSPAPLLHLVARHRRRAGRRRTPNIFASGGPQSYYARRLARGKGNSGLDIRHRLVVSGVVWSAHLLAQHQRAGASTW